MDARALCLTAALAALPACATTREAEIVSVDGSHARAWLVDGRTAWKDEPLAAPPRAVCRGDRCSDVVRVESCASACGPVCGLRPECPADGDLLRLARRLALVTPYRRALAPSEIAAPPPAPPPPHAPPPAARPVEDPQARWERDEAAQRGSAWREDDRRWIAEASLGGAVAQWSVKDPATGALTATLATGGTASLGFRRQHRFGEEVIPHGEKEVPLIGAETIDLLLGNQRGLDLHVVALDLVDAGDPRWLVAAGVKPILRVHKVGSRWRFPSLLGAVLPEVGVTFLEHTAALHVALDPLPIGLGLTGWLAVELHPFEGAIVVPFDGTARTTVGARLAFVIR